MVGSRLVFQAIRAGQVTSHCRRPRHDVGGPGAQGCQAPLLEAVQAEVPSRSAPVGFGHLAGESGDVEEDVVHLPNLEGEELAAPVVGHAEEAEGERAALHRGSRGGRDDPGADSTLFAMVPLDVVLQYFYRAKRTAGAVPAGRRLAWLQARDMEERAEWTSRFREGTASLGVVIKEVALVRDAHWLTPVGVDQPVTPVKGSQEKATGQPSGASPFKLGKPVNGKQVARVMKDGTQLCPGFQRGECRAKQPCQGGAHRCGAILKNGVRGGGDEWRATPRSPSSFAERAAGVKAQVGKRRRAPEAVANPSDSAGHSLPRCWSHRAPHRPQFLGRRELPHGLPHGLDRGPSSRGDRAALRYLPAAERHPRVV